MSNQPNILFIMSDDHTTQGVGVYGSRLAGLDPTPNIDALANNGMRFDRVFCHNSICTPSRANIMTGQYSQTNGVLDLGGSLPPERQFLPTEMKKAGYQTAMIGKWHLKAEPSTFDYYCVLPGQGRYFDPEFLTRGDRAWPENGYTAHGEHSTDAITDLTLEWLAEKRDKGKPFFLMHHYKAPHDMFEHAPRYDDYLADTEIPEPFNLFDPPNGSVGSAGFGSGIGRSHAPWRLAEKLGIPEDLDDQQYAKAAYQEYLKRYLRCVKGIDDNVGRIVAHLEESGELNSTVIIYTGDQGFFLGEHDLMDKRWMYEESMRMPFVVHWPDGIAPNQTNDWLINNTDFAPTMFELVGIETPDYMQGRSFAPALVGDQKPDDWREATYYRYWMHMAHNLAVPAHFGIRSDRYKLVFFYGLDYRTESDQPQTPAAWEFYDLETDPFEMDNRYADPDYQQIISEMKLELKQAREELGETDRDYPTIQKVIDAKWND